jgi:hypothetical protein
MSNSNGNDQQWKNIVAWVQAAGGHVHPSLQLQGDGPARGVIATQTISKGDLLIRMPTTCVCSGISMEENWKSNNESSSSKSASPWLRCLAAYYQAASNTTTSKFQPYLESLPKEYETLFQWTDQQIHDYLAGTTLGKMIQLDRQEDSLKTRFHLGVRPYLEILGLLSAGKSEQEELEDFKRACMCLSTRGFHLRSEENDNSALAPLSSLSYNGPFLLPIIDLLNHDETNACTTLQRDATSGTFFMIAEHDIPSCEEVVHSYGDAMTSAQILQTFGFVPESHAQRVLKSSSPQADTASKWTAAVLSKTELLSACRKVAASDYPLQLQRSIQSNNTGANDEVWDVHNLNPRNTSHISNDLLLSNPRLSDELITLLCVQFLPDEAYDEIFGKSPSYLLDRSVVEDYYLGNLVCQALLTAIDEKVDAYQRPIEKEESDKVPVAKRSALERDRNSLRHKLHSKKTDNGVEYHRGVCGLTIQIEEMTSLEALRREVLEIITCLDTGSSIESIYNNSNDPADHSKPTKRPKLEDDTANGDGFFLEAMKRKKEEL